MSNIDIENNITFEKPDLKRLKSMKFETSRTRFETVKPSKILLQSFFHFFNIVKNMFKFIFCRCGFGTKGDDSINIRHMDPISAHDLDSFFGVVTGAVIDPIELENTPILTDRVFRIACNDASITCISYAKYFLIIEKVTKVAEVFAIFVFPIAAFIEFGKIDYIVAICIVIPIIMLKVMCDWSILMEKYACIADEFSKLANSKDENRIDEYEALVNRYRSSWLYSDNIKIKIF